MINRDRNGRFIKGHKTNSGRKYNQDEYENHKPYFFKVGNRIRNTGRTRFKIGNIHSKNWYKVMAEKKGKPKLRASKSLRKVLKISCLNCNAIFEANPSDHRKFCSLDCFYKYRKYPELLCEFCKKEFKYRLGGRFCSVECSNRFMTGREQKKEWIDKQRVQISGDKCWLWKGGISKEPYGLDFNNILKDQIRLRDNFRCQECFRHQDELRTKTNKKYKLIVHHIDFNKKNNNPDNLISLCRPCHSQTNYDRNEWIDYFQAKIGGLKNE